MEDIGYKALAVSVSDLASMGAKPAWCTLNLSLPAAKTEWITAFAQGLAQACARWEVDLIGGDTTRTSGPIVISLTLGGPCVYNPVQRGNAQLGDGIWVTGIPGLAALGWMQSSPRPASLTALRRPTPPLEFALQAAALGLFNAAIDLSDGLSSDLPRLLRASGVGAVVWPNALPTHPDLQAAPDALRCQARLAGGDDYQLLFTAPQAHRTALEQLARTQQIRLSCIGAVRVGELHIPDGWPTAAFRHFCDSK